MGSTVRRYEQIVELGYGGDDAEELVSLIDNLMSNDSFAPVVSKWLDGELDTTRFMMGLLNVWSELGKTMNELGKLIWLDEEEVPPLEEIDDSTIEMEAVKDKDYAL
jgi:hypothetical protein